MKAMFDRHASINRRAFMAGTAAAGAALALPSLPAFAAEDLSGQTIRVAVEKGGDYLLMQTAGLADTPYKVEAAEFASGNLVVEAINGGALELGLMSQVPVAFAAAGKANVSVLAVVTENLNLQALLVPAGSTVKSITELKGKKVGYVRATTTHYFLARMLEKAGMSFSDIEGVALTPADGLAAFNQGSLDAWAIFGLNVVNAVKNGAHILEPGKGYLSGHAFYATYPGHLQDEKKVAAMADYLQRLKKAYLWRDAHIKEWAKIHAEATGLPPELDEEIITNADKNRYLSPVTEADIANAQQVADTFHALGLIPVKADVAPLFNVEFGKRLG